MLGNAVVVVIVYLIHQFKKVEFWRELDSVNNARRFGLFFHSLPSAKRKRVRSTLPR